MRFPHLELLEKYLGNMDNNTTAAIIIIGNEILQGEVQDTNTIFLCQELLKCGVQVMKVSVIPDVIEIIAEEVAKFSSQYTYVLTSGGIGSTHDDVTYEGVAKAFQEEILLNEEFESVMQDICRSKETKEEIVRKMCYIPKSSAIHHTKIETQAFIPLVSVKNVYIFPGVPHYLKKMFLHLKAMFSSPVKFHCRKIYLNVAELVITPYLDDVVEQFPDVEFGSYMNVTDSSYTTKITLKSNSEEELRLAEAYLRSAFPMNCIIFITKPRSSESLKEFTNMLNRNDLKETKFITNMTNSISAVEKCLSKYSPQEVCLSFNGGKDCTALLHFLACMFSKSKLSTRINVFYVCSEDPFLEVEDFISQSARRYDLHILKYDFPIKDALEKLKSDHPNIKAILLGTRYSDPHGHNLETFQMTDNNWPQFMRVSPILHWGYHDVWRFLRELNVPYCSLYDCGYTSLGCRQNTMRNLKLKSQTKMGKEFYKPAYLLDDCKEERDGRKM